MAIAAEMRHLARAVITSYEARVSSLEQMIETTYEMLETFRSQREAMKTQLRETLARAASLRRRDFDAMIQGILARREEREQTVKETMRGYFEEHRTMAVALREALALGEAEGIGTVKKLLERVTVRRQEREREVRALLAEFQSEQEELARALGKVLSNGGSVSVKEFRAALRAIQSRRWSRSDLATRGVGRGAGAE